MSFKTPAAALAAAILISAGGCGLAGVAVLPPPPGPKEDIIDVHCHAAGLGYGSDCWYSPTFKKSIIYKGAMSGYEINEETIKKHGDHWAMNRYAQILRESRYVGKACLMAMDGTILDDGVTLDKSRTDFYIPNEFVRDVVRRNPDVFLYACSINPYRKDAVERLRQAAKDGAVEVKWLPNAQHFSPADPRVIPFYKECKRLGMPICTHTGAEHTAQIVDQRFGNPALLIPALEMGVTVIAAHTAVTNTVAGRDDFEVLRQMMKTFPNLYGDTAGFGGPGDYGKAVGKVARTPEIHDRILFATDMPNGNVWIITKPQWLMGDLTQAQINALEVIANPYDKDIMIKKTVGMPDKCFTGARKVLRDPKAPVPPPEN